MTWRSELHQPEKYSSNVQSWENEDPSTNCKRLNAWDHMLASKTFCDLFWAVFLRFRHVTVKCLEAFWHLFAINYQSDALENRRQGIHRCMICHQTPSSIIAIQQWLLPTFVSCGFTGEPNRVPENAKRRKHKYQRISKVSRKILKNP